LSLRLKIAIIEKMKARVKIKTEPRIAPPTARLLLNEKCPSLSRTRAVQRRNMAE
jgi:hypothetical protein